MRAGLYNWRSSSKAAARLKAATTEIRNVYRSNPIVAGEGIVALAERIWPAFEQIDTSSGMLGSAVSRTLSDLLPILIEAPADLPTRARWLERLRAAIESDGVQYLDPISKRFGEIAHYSVLQNEHADRDLGIIRDAWSDHSSYSFITTSTLTLSCLLEAGRYDELSEVVNLRKSRSWSDSRFVAEALLRQGRVSDALAYAGTMFEPGNLSRMDREVALFCESILVRQGRQEEAYVQFGLPSASGNTYTAIWRDLVKRYPDIDARKILDDLIVVSGSKGKWFAAAKTAHFFDIALECAAQSDAAPATLIRAARDYKLKEPDFAAQVALHGIRHLIDGRGYEPTPSDIDEAVDHLMAACKRNDKIDWAVQELRRMVAVPNAVSIMVERLRKRLATMEASSPLG